MKTIHSLLLFCSMFNTVLLQAQDSFPNILSLIDSTASPKAKIMDVAWIAGHWQGEAFGGITEESWTPPLGNSMMGVFKLVNAGQTNFYEIIIISEEKETLVMKLKHFHSDLRGWEEKEDYVKARLVKLEPKKVYFDGFTYERVDDTHLNIYVLMEEDAKYSEMKFSFESVSLDQKMKN